MTLPPSVILDRRFDHRNQFRQDYDVAGPVARQVPQAPFAEVLAVVWMIKLDAARYALSTRPQFTGTGVERSAFSGTHGQATAFRFLERGLTTAGAGAAGSASPN